MTNIANLRRRLAQSFGIAATAVWVMSATQRAEALSPVSPAASPIARMAADAMITEVHGHGGGGGGFHGGGGGFHGGGGGFHGGAAFHGGGAVFHGGGFRSAAPVFHGGGLHTLHGGGFYHHDGGARFVFAHHHHHRHFGLGFYGYGYDDYPAYYYDYPRRCRIIYTDYGPRRICHYHRWHHRWHHYRHHHRRHHHWY
jgi:hypothetical protein